MVECRRILKRLGHLGQNGSTTTRSTSPSDLTKIFLFHYGILQMCRIISTKLVYLVPSHS